jgi:hypothetical protein
MWKITNILFHYPSLNGLVEDIAITQLNLEYKNIYLSINFMTNKFIIRKNKEVIVNENNLYDLDKNIKKNELPLLSKVKITNNVKIIGYENDSDNNNSDYYNIIEIKSGIYGIHKTGFKLKYNDLHFFKSGVKDENIINTQNIFINNIIDIFSTYTYT